MRLARGNYVGFLDSDDLFLPGKLGMQVQYLNDHPEVGMIYTSAYCIDANGNPINHFYEASISGNIYADVAFFRPVTITLPTVMVRREVFDKVGGFDEAMERFEDTDMWRRISKHYVVDAIATPTCKLRTHEGNALLGQNLDQIKNAVCYYVNKVFSEDRDIESGILNRGASDLCFFYAKALLGFPAGFFSGCELIFKSVRYQPLKSYRFLYVGYGLLKCLIKK